MNRRVSLNQIRIQEPCPMSWSEMTGDDASRFCSHCNLTVHNLSALTREQAETLVAQAEGRLCVGYAFKPTGEMITREAAGRSRLGTWLRAAGTAAAFAVGFLPFSNRLSRYAKALSSNPSNDPMVAGGPRVVPTAPATQPTKLGEAVPPMIAGKPAVNPPMVMGDVCLPPATQPATGPTTEPTE